MNLLPGRAQGDDLFQKGDELTAGVVGGSFAVDAAGGGIQRRIQGEGSVAVVFEAVAFGASRRERQDWIETVQGLNGGLLIDTEHGGMLRVRRIVAVLLKVGHGKMDVAGVAAALDAGRPALSGAAAPARGLCLRRVALGRPARDWMENSEHHDREDLHAS